MPEGIPEAWEVVTVTPDRRAVVPLVEYVESLGELAHRLAVERGARDGRRPGVVYQFVAPAEGDADRRSPGVLRRLADPHVFRNMDYLRLRARFDPAQCHPEFRRWRRTFRRRMDERRIALFEIAIAGSSVAFGFFESCQRTLAPHHGGRVVELGKAEWSVIAGIALEVARACEVSILWDSGEPSRFALGDLPVEPEALESEAWLPSDFGNSGYKVTGAGFKENGEVIEDYVSKDGWRWFGREPIE